MEQNSDSWALQMDCGVTIGGKCAVKMDDVVSSVWSANKK